MFDTALLSLPLIWMVILPTGVKDRAPSRPVAHSSDSSRVGYPGSVCAQCCTYIPSLEPSSHWFSKCVWLEERHDSSACELKTEWENFYSWSFSLRGHVEPDLTYWGDAPGGERIRAVSLASFPFGKTTLILLWFKDTIYLFMRDSQREAETGRGRSRLHAGARCGTRSWDPRITPWAEVGIEPLSHPGCPNYSFFFLENIQFKKKKGQKQHPALFIENTTFSCKALTF